MNERDKKGYFLFPILKEFQNFVLWYYSENQCFDKFEMKSNEITISNSRELYFIS